MLCRWTKREFLRSCAVFLGWLPKIRPSHGTKVDKAGKDFRSSAKEKMWHTTAQDRGGGGGGGWRSKCSAGLEDAMAKRLEEDEAKKLEKILLNHL